MPPVTGAGAAITVRRRVAWNETDAAGHNHFSAAFRWLEEAEHLLFRCLGVEPALIDRIPRVHIEVDYADRLYFSDVIDVSVSVARVGTSSCSFDFEVRKADGSRAITGSYVIVHASSTSSGSAAWPTAVSEALSRPQEFTRDHSA